MAKPGRPERRELEEEYLKQDYLSPKRLPTDALKEVYRKRQPQDDEEEMRAVRASYRPKRTPADRRARPHA